jgi:formate-dependent phosphoribosylglycinamide formyltransferase (GAR transformylase)
MTLAEKAVTPGQLKDRRLLLLFATTGYEGRDFLEAARRLGVSVVPGTDRCRALENFWENDGLSLRFGDPEYSAGIIQEFARQQPIHGIFSAGDMPTRTAALASQRLGLPHNPLDAADACRNKFIARQRLRTGGLAVPSFTRLPLDADSQPVAAEASYPCVLKPLTLSASRGVIRADTAAQFNSAFARIQALLRSSAVQVRKDEANDWIMVEDYIPGREVALEGLLDEGQLRVLALFDKPDPLDGPYFEESLYITPSREDGATQRRIVEVVRRAARALGLVHGPVHAELRLNDRGLWVLEIAARSIGGLCSRTLRFGAGMSLEELLIRHTLGMEIEVRREADAAGVMMLPIPKAGIYEQVEGIDEALAIDGMDEVTITAKSSQVLLPLPEGDSYLGFMFARGHSPEFVEQALRTAHRKLRFTISPVLPVAASTA